MSRYEIFDPPVHHGAGMLYWLDGSSAETPAGMVRVPSLLTLALTTRPDGLEVLNGYGKTGLLHRLDSCLRGAASSMTIDGRPLPPSFPVAGVVSDPLGRYIPRRFRVSVGSGLHHELVVYPSPLGTRLGPAGGLVGTLRFADSMAPVPWALLTLTLTDRMGALQQIRCQADVRGDFLLSFDRLCSRNRVRSGTGRLTIMAPASPDPAPLDPADLVTMDLGHDQRVGCFTEHLTLQVAPGQVRCLSSAESGNLIVRPHQCLPG